MIYNIPKRKESIYKIMEEAARDSAVLLGAGRFRRRFFEQLSRTRKTAEEFFPGVILQKKLDKDSRFC
jgi:hypothetical protein